MHIVVCVKHVPDLMQMMFNPTLNTFEHQGKLVRMWNSPAGYMFNPASNTLIREGVPGMANPFDEHAIEEALLIKQRVGGNVVVISMGPPQAEEVLRGSLAMGADEAILVSDPALAGSDTLVTSRVLATAIRHLGTMDMVLCGAQTIDGATGQVAPAVAHRLNVPVLTCVRRISEIDVDRRRITVERLLEGGREVVEASLPVVLTVMRGINKPRYPTLHGLKRSAKADIPVWDAVRLGLEAADIGIAGSATHVVRISSPPPRAGQADMIEGSLAETTAALVERLLGDGGIVTTHRAEH
jgi:electron transfer flavoprotein beta subunit